MRPKLILSKFFSLFIVKFKKLGFSTPLSLIKLTLDYLKSGFKCIEI